MKIADINPFIRYARRHKYLYNHPHRSVCRDCRLFFVQSGYGTVDINGTEYNFSKGTAMYFPFGTKYRFKPAENQKKLRLLVLNFDLDHSNCHHTTSLGTVAEQNYRDEMVMRTPQPDAFKEALLKSAPQLEGLLLQIIAEYFNEGPLYREIGSACLKQCLTVLLREQEGTANTPLVQQVIAYIEEHYADATLQNAQIAERFGYHPYYLSNILKQNTGYSLRSYLIRHRIQMAKNDLLTTDLTVSTISWRCGFSSEPFFIKTFKEHTGTTPKKYRSEWFVSNP